MSKVQKLAACLLNVSEARNKTAIEQIARSGIVRKEGQLQTTILNVFSDDIYNRSVITIAGTLKGVESGVLGAALAALDILPAISSHQGGHPRKGTVDLIPIHPITDGTTLDECGQVARNISKELLSTGQIEAFHFGWADPERRSLVQMRKMLGWFTDKPSATKHGLVGIGAVPYMTNFNVTISTKDLKVGSLKVAQIALCKLPQPLTI